MKYTAIISLLILTLTQFVQAGEEREWVIQKEGTAYSNYANVDSAWLTYKLAGLPNAAGDQAMMKRADMDAILKHFGVTSVEDLGGKSFKSSYKFGWEIWDEFLHIVRGEGKYRKPTKSEVMKTFAEGLARMQCPDFSKWDKGAVMEVLRPLLLNSITPQSDLAFRRIVGADLRRAASRLAITPPPEVRIGNFETIKDRLEVAAKTKDRLTENYTVEVRQGLKQYSVFIADSESGVTCSPIQTVSVDSNPPKPEARDTR